MGRSKGCSRRFLVRLRTCSACSMRGPGPQVEPRPFGPGVRTTACSNRTPWDSISVGEFVTRGRLCRGSAGPVAVRGRRSCAELCGGKFGGMGSGSDLAAGLLLSEIQYVTVLYWTMGSGSARRGTDSPWSWCEAVARCTRRASRRAHPRSRSRGRGDCDPGGSAATATSSAPSRTPSGPFPRTRRTATSPCTSSRRTTVGRGRGSRGRSSGTRSRRRTRTARWRSASRTGMRCPVLQQAYGRQLRQHQKARRLAPVSLLIPVSGALQGSRWSTRFS